MVEITTPLGTARAFEIVTLLRRGIKMSATAGRDFANAVSPSPSPATPSIPAQQSAKSDRFDIVVAGAGHNSLAATAYLAKAGYRCLVLEGRPTVGGGAKTAELTLRGFKPYTCSAGD